MKTIIIFIAALFICSLTSGTLIAQTSTFSIKAGNEKFSPGTITVKAGQVVKLKITGKKDTNADNGITHTWTISELNIDFKIKEGSNNFSFVAPDSEGTYTVLCTNGCGDKCESMTMKLVVKP